MYTSGSLIENFTGNTKTFNKARGYTPLTKTASALAKYSIYGDATKRALENNNTRGNESHHPTSLDQGERDYLQAVQLYHDTEKPVNRWDMIHPHWIMAENQYGGDAGNVEMLVNGQQRPLPFAESNFQTIEAQALSEGFEARADPLSARYAAYDVHPELASIEADYRTKDHRVGHKTQSSAPPAYMRHSKKYNRELDYSNKYGTTKAHQFESGTKPNAVLSRPRRPTYANVGVAPAQVKPTTLEFASPDSKVKKTRGGKKAKNLSSILTEMLTKPDRSEIVSPHHPRNLFGATPGTTTPATPAGYTNRVKEWLRDAPGAGYNNPGSGDPGSGGTVLGGASGGDRRETIGY